ncbi:MAG: PAC2 family protein [Acidimicrobiales bacterium]
MDPVIWHRRPQLRRPVLVASFEGWNDAGDASTMAVQHLQDTWGAEPFASIDPEEFHDFTEDRPIVHLVDGITRRISWPEHALSSCTPPGSAEDVAFLVAVEPQLRWRTYATAVLEVVKALDCSLVLTLGSLLADTPHTRPVRITGTAHDPQLARSLGLTRSRYEGPTGIVGVLHEQLAQAGVPSVSLWAAVPHYVGRNPSPPAALALVERASSLLRLPVDTTDLRAAAAEYLTEIDDAVQADEEAREYVLGLERAEDEPAIPEALQLGELRRPEDEGVTMAGADELAAEVERFLRNQEGR